MNNEMPAVGYSSYASSQALNLNEHLQQFNQASLNQMAAGNQFTQAALIRRSPQIVADPPMEPAMASTRRLVQVFVVDPHESVPLDQCLLYKGDLKLTDATDQELFYEIDIRTILDKHNAQRVKVIDRKVKERVEHLEPARIRDLRMQIVEVAKF